MIKITSLIGFNKNPKKEGSNVSTENVAWVILFSTHSELLRMYKVYQKNILINGSATQIEVERVVIVFHFSWNSSLISFVCSINSSILGSSKHIWILMVRVSLQIFRFVVCLQLSLHKPTQNKQPNCNYRSYVVNSFVPRNYFCAVEGH